MLSDVFCSIALHGIPPYYAAKRVFNQYQAVFVKTGTQVLQMLIPFLSTKNTVTSTKYE